MVSVQWSVVRGSGQVQRQGQWSVISDQWSGAVVRARVRIKARVRIRVRIWVRVRVSG